MNSNLVTEWVNGIKFQLGLQNENSYSIHPLFIKFGWLTLLLVCNADSNSDSIYFAEILWLNEFRSLEI